MAIKKITHAPAPWRSIKYEHVEYRILDNHGRDIATIASAVPLFDTERQYQIEHNMRLIASAPKLLSALKECITSERSASLTRGGDMARRRLLAINDLAQKLVDEVEVEDVRYVYEKGGL